MDSAKLELFRGTLDVLILKALVWGPLHGYGITSLIRRQSDDALLVEEGTLYPALVRLEGAAQGRVGTFREQSQGQVLSTDRRGAKPTASRS